MRYSTQHKLTQFGSNACGLCRQLHSHQHYLMYNVLGKCRHQIFEPSFASDLSTAGAQAFDRRLFDQCERRRSGVADTLWNCPWLAVQICKEVPRHQAAIEHATNTSITCTAGPPVFLRC